MSRFYRYGDIVHYRWGGTPPRPHQASMVIGRTRNDMLLLVTLSDSHLTGIDAYSMPIVGKVAAMYEPCTPHCEYHPYN